MELDSLQNRTHKLAWGGCGLVTQFQKEKHAILMKIDVFTSSAPEYVCNLMIHKELCKFNLASGLPSTTDALCLQSRSCKKVE